MCNGLLGALPRDPETIPAIKGRFPNVALLEAVVVFCLNRWTTTPAMISIDQPWSVQHWMLIVSFVIQGLVCADPPPGYYDVAKGQSGADLRFALHAIVRNHRALPYSGSPHPNTADALGILDEDPANTNNVLGIYSGYSIAKTDIGSASGTWNREHLWPQSYGAETGPARTDLHHMRPEQANVNSSRGNNYYDQSNPDAPGYKAFSNAVSGFIPGCVVAPAPKRGHEHEDFED